MKKYNKTFVCTFSVDRLAQELYESLFPNSKFDLEKDFDEGVEKENHIKDIEHWTRVTESIMNNIYSNQDACAEIFDALNGWVKTETPMDRAKPVTACQSDNPEDIGFGSSVSFQLPNSFIEEYKMNKDWLNSFSNFIGNVSKVKEVGVVVSFKYVNSSFMKNTIKLTLPMKSLSSVSHVTESFFKTDIDKWIENNIH